MPLGQILYFATAGLVILWLARILQYLNSNQAKCKIHLSHLWTGILGAMVITSIVFVTTRPDYRVLSDEATLTSISKMMYQDKTATTLFMTKVIDNRITPIAQGIDKRPTLFPFVVHLVHGVLGYQPSNPFIANFIILATLLVLIYLPISLHWGRMIAHTCQLLVAAQVPVLAAASSAGFDLFSSLLLIVSLLLVARTIQDRSADTLSLTLITLVLFSYTRYESILFAMIMGFFVFVALRPKLSEISSQARWLIWTPGLLAPLVWLLYQSRASRFYEVKAGESIFSWTNLVTHTADLASGLYSPPSFLPNQTVFHWMALFSAVALLWTILRSKPTRSTQWIMTLTGLIAFSSLLLVLSHFFGSYLKADALRLFTNFAISWAVLPGVLLGVLTRRKILPPLTSQIVGLLLAGLLFYRAVFHCSQPELFADVGGMHAYQASRKFLENKPKDRVLTVSSYPTHFAILDFASINFDTFLRNWEKISKELSSGQLTHVYVFQSIPLTTGIPTPEEEIGALPLQRIIHQESPISSRNRIRISELTAPITGGPFSHPN